VGKEEPGFKGQLLVGVLNKQITTAVQRYF
jgi:hypothetical protein